MVRSITLLGSSSGRNAGDAALIAGIMDAIDETVKDRVLYEIPTIKPSYIERNYQNRTRPISMMPWALSVKMLGVPTYRSLLRTDMSLIFDAILFDRQLYNPLFNYLSSVYLLLPAAKRAGRKLGCYNVGVGPISTPNGKSMLRDVLEMMDFITIRDQAGIEIVRDIGVKNPRIVRTADAALNMAGCSPERTDQIIRSAGFEPGEELFCANISAYLDSWASPGRKSMGKEAFLTEYVAGLNRFAKETKAPILFVCTQVHDVPVTREIMARVDPSIRTGIVTNIEYNHYDIRGVFERVSMLFAMRLHANILCSAAHTPVLGLPHQPKVAHYFDVLGLPECNLGFDRFNADSMYRHLMMGWERRPEIRQRLEQRVPVLQREAMKAAQLVNVIHTGGDLDAAIASMQQETRLAVGNG